jgi:hypothetical protein
LEVLLITETHMRRELLGVVGALTATLAAVAAVEDIPVAEAKATMNPAAVEVEVIVSRV